jgi:hypothetical protein
MSQINVLFFFNLGIVLSLLYSRNVAANPLISGPFVASPSIGQMLTATRVLEGSSDCHCDGTTIHCSNVVEEEFCSCANETLSCANPFEGCTCHGSVVHCNDSSVESACQCDEGTVNCE